MKPSSLMSILQPVSAVIFWMTLPPVPMTSRILSGLIFAAGADDLADLVGVDLHLDHLRRGLGQLLARLCQSLEHDLVEDLQAGLTGDGEGVLHDLVLETVVLEVHLDGGDALAGAGHLEVHLAVEVFHALDVDEGGEVVAVLDQAAGDAEPLEERTSDTTRIA